MKIIKRVVSIILAVIIMLSSCFVVSADTTEPDKSVSYIDSLCSKDDYKEFLLQFSKPAVSTKQFMNFIKIINTPFKVLTGRFLFPEEKFNVTVDEKVQALSDHILANSGVDIVSFATNLPDINNLAELTVKAFNIDTKAFRDEMISKANEYYSDSNFAVGAVYHFFGVYLSVIQHCEIVMVQTESNPEIYEIIMNLHYKDGEVEEIHPGFYINSVTGECTNRDNSGIVGVGFNFSINEMITYATVDAWMRNFGFCLFYDIAANSMPLIWNYNTRRFKFDYDGLEWMVQIWKGNYLVANGGEVGLYSRTADKSGTFYECANDEQMLKMSMEIYAGDELLVNREPHYHWWVSGFHINGMKYPPASLTMKFSIEFENEEMLKAFCEAVDKNYRRDVEYVVEGLTVKAIW